MITLSFILLIGKAPLIPRFSGLEGVLFFRNAYDVLHDVSV